MGLFSCAYHPEPNGCSRHFCLSLSLVLVGLHSLLHVCAEILCRSLGFRLIYLSLVFSLFLVGTC